MIVQSIAFVYKPSAELVADSFRGRSKYISMALIRGGSLELDVGTSEML
jgi:hypothetical protein